MSDDRVKLTVEGAIATLLLDREHSPEHRGVGAEPPVALSSASAING